jgi:hypothetical protein
MKSKKPKGAQYRGLIRRGSVIYYRRMFEGKLVRFSLDTDDWDEAAKARALYEDQRRGRPLGVELPRFEEFAGRYLKEATGDLAATTREDRVKLLRPGGIVTRVFATSRVDAITKPRLLEWWQREVEGRKRSPRTGLVYLSALSGVFNYAVDLDLLAENPVDGLRGILRRRRHTKRGRAAADRAAHVRPIESPEEFRRFVEVSSAAYSDRFPYSGKNRLHRWRGHVADLLMLDAGLRTGEVSGVLPGFRRSIGPKLVPRALRSRKMRARRQAETVGDSVT